MVIGIFAIGGVLVFSRKGPFCIQITSYQFVYSLVEGQPAKDTLRKTNVTFLKTGIKTAVFRRRQDQQAKQFTKMPPPLYKIQVWGKNSNIREFSRIKNRVFHSVTVRKTINLTMPMYNIKNAAVIYTSLNSLPKI